MKFTKFGKAVLMGALSAGVLFGVSSCVVSYTTGYLYVTGTVTAQPNGNGIISGYRIDHNTGLLTTINGLPVSSGGANPVRAVLLSGSRFMYVLNRGLNAQGNGDCTTADPCQNANITQFAVGGNGILTPQETFFSQGTNPFRLMADTSGDYLMVLDHDSPDNYATSYNPNTNGCTLALGSGVTTCGDITIFQINQTTGRLSLVENAQVTAAGGQPLTYFPVPENPVEFLLSGSYVLTLTAATQPASFPYTGGSQVWPYTYATTTGQLTLSQNSTQPLNITQGTAILSAQSVIYVLDNEPLNYINSNQQPATTNSQILAFTLGANGALQAETDPIIPDDPTLSNPIQILEESKNKYLYVANQGDNLIGNNPQSGIAGYNVFTGPFQLQPTTPSHFGSGSGPQCIVEDPSDQFIYTANLYDSSVTGQIIDPNSGNIFTGRVNSDYPLQGPATWCLIDGRVG
jgi:6-phosphogluconolactonase (cycloisomerase 2 family)